MNAMKGKVLGLVMGGIFGVVFSGCVTQPTLTHEPSSPEEMAQMVVAKPEDCQMKRPFWFGNWEEPLPPHQAKDYVYLGKVKWNCAGIGSDTCLTGFLSLINRVAPCKYNATHIVFGPDDDLGIWWSSGYSYIYQRKFLPGQTRLLFMEDLLEIKALEKAAQENENQSKQKAS